jgi:hypothetical protein
MGDISHIPAEKAALSSIRKLAIQLKKKMRR